MKSTTSHDACAIVEQQCSVFYCHLSRCAVSCCIGAFDSEVNRFSLCAPAQWFTVVHSGSRWTVLESPRCFFFIKKGVENSEMLPYTMENWDVECNNASTHKCLELKKVHLSTFELFTQNKELLQTCNTHTRLYYWIIWKKHHNQTGVLEVRLYNKFMFWKRFTLIINVCFARVFNFCQV